MLGSMYEWLYADIVDEKNSRQKKRNASNARFATLNGDLQVQCGKVDHDQDSDEEEEED